MSSVDVIIVGAGHNGLVAAAYLAKAGRKVLVLERNGAPGGQLAAGMLGPGFDAPALHPGGRLRPDIVRDLDLARHGLSPAVAAETPYVSLLPDGGTLRLTSLADDAATLEAIRKLSSRDAARWPEFVAFMNAAAGWVDAVCLLRESIENLDALFLPRVASLGPLLWALALGARGRFGRAFLLTGAVFLFHAPTAAHTLGLRIV